MLVPMRVWRVVPPLEKIVRVVALTIAALKTRHAPTNAGEMAVLQKMPIRFAVIMDQKALAIIFARTFARRDHPATLHVGYPVKTQRKNAVIPATIASTPVMWLVTACQGPARIAGKKTQTRTWAENT